MEPKAELLVFNKKEVAVIIVLLVLVAMFSFTLGLRLGKTLGAGSKPSAAEHAPLSEQQAAGGHGEAHGENHESAPAEGHGAPAADHGAHGDAHSTPAAASEQAVHESADATHADPSQEATDASAPGEHATDAAQKAESQADDEFVKEASQQKLSPGKAIPMTLPTEKKGEHKAGDAALGSGYTLQVGSHRTVAEAAEQVSGLKRSGLDAFYLEANVPGKGTWYRVGIGFYPNKDAAERAAAKMKSSKKQLPSYIVQKINE